MFAVVVTARFTVRVDEAELEEVEEVEEVDGRGGGMPVGTTNGTGRTLPVLSAALR